MHAIVTGAAGFIGSHVAETLLADGATVRGIDCLTSYYDVDLKRANLAVLQQHPGFEHVDADLRDAPLEQLIDGADVVYHLAARAGVRGSWADGFARYAAMNILSTQRLLEAVRATSVARMVYASSSSVYGNAHRYPTTEEDLTRPFSPYGVTKLAAEHLCRAYAENFGVSTASLRYFTVYGPRQRPEMAIQQMIQRAYDDQPFHLFGTGQAIRDFTYVGDIARATVDAGTMEVPDGVVMNVGGGAPVSMNDLIEKVRDAIGRPLRVERQRVSAGDVQRTGGATDRARDLLGWTPRFSLEEGIRNQVAWYEGQRRGPTQDLVVDLTDALSRH